MSDLISRQDFDKCLEDAEKESVKNRKYVFASALNTIRGNLRNFPSAQPESTIGQLNTDAQSTKMDLISRQAAIDAVKGRFSMPVDNLIVEVIGELPSAQPYTDEEIQKMQDIEQAQIEKAFELGREDAKAEIVRCKDCKHFEYDHPYIIQGIPVLGHEVCNAWGDGCKTDENGWCFLAERRDNG